MPRSFLSIHNKIIWRIIGASSLTLIGVLAIMLLQSQSRPVPTSATAELNDLKLAGLKQRAEPAVALLLEALAPRTASAAEPTDYDTVADKVYGQPDFITGTAPSGNSDLTLNQPADVFVFDTGQIFIADTAGNRVLGWDSVDSYENGDPADLVLGQPNFTTADAPDPPTATSMNAPTGITVGYDGIIYVSDSGNNRVLVFIPWNICDFYEYYDDIWCIEEDGYEFSEVYWPVFTSGMEADYALGQPDLETGSLAPASQTSLNEPMGLVTDINDNLVVADTGNNRVLIYQWPLTDGKEASWIVGQVLNDSATIGDFTSTAAPDPPTALSLNAPTSVAVGTTANELYVADTGNNRILVYNNEPIDGRADAVIGQPDFTSNSAGVGSDMLDSPTGLKMDAGNRLFVADTNNNRVVAFDQINPDGQADEVFGQPDYDSNTPNNGGLTATSLFAPTGVATDAYFMDIYIADQGNNRVLQYYQPLVNPTPDIAEMNPGTVLAGSDSFTIDIWGSGIIDETVVEVNGVERASSSEFLGLIQVEINASEIMTTGEVIISLSNPAPGGGPSAPFELSVYEPQLGDTGADYVIGQQGFTTNYGEFTRVSANSLDSPAGVVIDPGSGRLFVSDQRNRRVLSWASSAARANGQEADLVLGQPDFETWDTHSDSNRNLVSPVGLALDSQGNLYVADAGNDVVQLFTPPFTNGMASSLTIDGLSNPMGLLVDSQDNLYVADALNHRVLFYEAPLLGGDTTPDRVFGQPDFNSTDSNQGGPISAETLNFPTGLALDSANNLYVADSANHRVLVYLAGNDGDTTADLVFGQGGDFTTGSSNNGGVTAESLNFPFALLLDASGTLYVADRDNHRILGYAQPLTSDRVADEVWGQNGSFTQNQPNAGGRSQSSLEEPVGLALANDGALFVADLRNHRILVFLTDKASQQGGGNIYLPIIIR